ncbi:DUF177 domain-containing protein [bacterium]|nr:DUF177 domain-containing protein [bacterium]
MPVLTIEVEQLHHGPMELSAKMTPAQFEIAEDPEFRFDQPIEVAITARLVGKDSVGVRGTVRTSAVAECVRCLYELRIPLEANVNLVFLKRPPAGTEEAEGLDKDDEKLYYRGEVVYPLSQLREELLVNLPYLPACELEDGNFCPVRKERVKLGAGEEAADEKSESTNSWQSQLAELKKKLDKSE